MSKTKWNYAVVKTIFGDLWVGKTKLEPVPCKIFTKLKDAIAKAQILFEDRHPEFDPDADVGDENYDDELLMQYEEIEETTEETAEEIPAEKFIV